MKKLITILMFLFLVLLVNAQVIKYKSTQSSRTDNSLNTKRLEETSYLTFDFDKKLITIKTLSVLGLGLVGSVKLIQTLF